MTGQLITKRFEFPIGWIIVGVLSLAAFITTINGQTVTKVDRVGFTVSDMDKAVDFYTRVLPFNKVKDQEIAGPEFERLSGVFGARVRIVDLTLGSETLELTEYLAPQGRPVPIDSQSNDRWFQHIAIIVSDMDAAYRHLRANKIRHASTGPQTLPSYITAAAGISAFYFKDPDGHVLEVLSFPPDKGAMKWRDRASSRTLFLGIDHTAIVVGDSAASLSFYRDTLGLNVVGTSDNYGPEQEHLNNVFGAKLHITGLHTAEDGIAVEFLKYIAPTTGRPFPADTRSNDLWHWETTFAVKRLDSIFKGAEYISSGLLTVNKDNFGFGKAAMIRDPDGHAVRLTGN
jgi:catechol 2,3-dioxygenase-like lactoylglutathione lyase family enzyme